MTLVLPQLLGGTWKFKDAFSGRNSDGLQLLELCHVKSGPAVFNPFVLSFSLDKLGSRR